MADNEEYGGPPHDGDGGIGGDDWDSRKAFISRIPSAFDSGSVKRILEEKFGTGSVEDVSIVYNREDGDDGEEGRGGEQFDEARAESSNADDSSREHRGFGFATFFSASVRDEAIKVGTVRGGARETSKRKQTIYIRPLDRSSAEGGDEGNKNICHLWSMKRCPYGDDCKFQHVGEGACIDKPKDLAPLSKAERDKKKKCFSFKKKGKCAKGDACPFSHDVNPAKQDDGDDGNAKQAKSASEKDCINWKKKGKCRKLLNSKGGCPYRHDEKVRAAALAKKADRSADNKRKLGDDGQSGGEKLKQPLWIRVFGMNYDTKEEDIRALFQDCGPIVEISFPTFEDSDRSKGYCGVLFQSPKAVEKALLLHETELHGRWLSVQAGKMMLKQWEARERKSRSEKGTADTDDKSNHTAEEALPEIGEFGQRVKKRKKHGHKD